MYDYLTGNRDRDWDGEHRETEATVPEVFKQFFGARTALWDPGEPDPE